MSTKKSKNSSIISNIVIGLLLLGFGYYKFIYSKKESDSKVATNTEIGNSAVGLKDSARAYTFSFMYANENELKRFKEIAETLGNDFQSQGLVLDWQFLNLTSPADMQRRHQMDFKVDSIMPAITNNAKDLKYNLLFKSDRCVTRPRLYVLNNSSFHSVNDLSGKKIIIIQIKGIPNVMYDFLLKSKLDGGELYSNVRQHDVRQALSSQSYDAILVNTYDFNGEQVSKSYNLNKEDFDKTFREVSFDYPDIPCMGIFASNELDKKVVDKFISIHQSLTEGYSKTKERSGFKRFTPEEMKKLIPNIDWVKVEKLRQNTKEFSKE